MSVFEPILSEPLDSLNGLKGLAELPKDFPALLVSIRRHLHMYPETGFQETKTSNFIRNKLESYGLEVQGPVAETGLFVDIEGAHPGPCVGYRADIDALPIQDAKQVPYASQHPGVAHLCGHDAHTTVGIGIALLLHQLRDQIHGTVRVFFQPNEEGSPQDAPSGSIPMIRDGVLENLDAAYCIHVDPTLEVGRYGLIVGPVTAAADRLRVLVRSDNTGHSARPHQTKDTVWITTQLLNLLYQYTGRITDTRNAAVLTICVLQGGFAHNVIPTDVAFEGTLRCLNNEDRTFLKHYMRRTVEEFAALHDVFIDLEFKRGVGPVINDERLIHNVETTVRKLFGDEAVFNVPVPSMGSEDFANYLDYVPGALVRVGTASGKRTSYPLHDANFDIDEHALAPTAQLMAGVLINHLRYKIMAE
ncbi:MAG: amidohydrolase [Rhodothermales bacterium]